MANHVRRFADAEQADPYVTTNRVSLQQLILENRAGLQRLAQHMESDVKELAGAVVILQRQMVALLADNAALKNQLLAASKGMNVSFTRLAQQPQIGPVGVGVPTHALRPQEIIINHNEDAGNVVGARPAADPMSSQVQSAMGDADQIFYSGGED